MKKIKLKTLYLIGIITIGLLGLGIGSTYAMFTTSIEIDNPITINTTLTCEEEVIDTTDIFIEANDFRVIVININNITSSGLNYSSFYITDNSDIDVGVTHKFSDGESPTGSIETNTNKKIYIQIKNNSIVKTKVTLGVLSSTGYIIKSENMTLVNDTNIDTEKPTLTITKSTSTSRTVTYTFTFSKKVSNFTSSDITVSEGTKGTFTKVSDTKYTLVVTHSSDGAKTITVEENVCNDLSGNNNTAKSLTNTIDTIKPTVTITKSTSTSRTVTYTFTFSEAVSGFTASGITVSEGTKGTFTKVSDTKYTLVVTHASDGSKTVTVTAGAAKDSAGNTNVATSLTNTISTGTPLATYITNLYNNATKTEVGPTGQKYQYDTTHNLMKDVGNNIRYYGASPNNYIYFNCDTYPSTNCEKWRIIGVTDGKVKLVRNEPIGKYSLDNSVTRGNSNWVNARLMKMLNPVSGTAGTGDGLYWNRKSGTCYSGSTAINATKTCDMSSIGLKEKTRTLIPDMTWYLRSGDDIDMLPSAAYNLERTTGKVYTGRATTWTGKVALIYSSDYGYAAEISNAIGSLGLRKHCTKMTLPNYSDTYCTSNNWLYPILSSGKSNARIMGHSTKEVYFAWYVTGNGSVGTEIVSWYEYNIVPTLYLNTSVSINTTGNGSSSNPYQIVS